ncbi:MAG: hypothetical protein M0R37_10465 [Bacteroidales bacterium]|jgi:hypothetical protein|nr:hypothetical protein [Bacteroidales bacterium]
MSHDEDVRLVDYLRKRLVQAADRDHADYASAARERDHAALAQIANLRAERDALMEEHEAGHGILRAIRDMGPRPDIHRDVVVWVERHWPTLWNALCAYATRHDKVEGMLAESAQQSHDVTTTHDREETP